jgi:hypothetical protein
MGTGTNGQEWAIVGGTGEFTQAQGVIYHKLSRSIKSGDLVHELDVHAFYTPMKRQKVRNTTHSAGPRHNKFMHDPYSAGPRLTMFCITASSIYA